MTLAPNTIYILGANQLSLSYYDRIIRAKAHREMRCKNVLMIDPNVHALADVDAACVIRSSYSQFVLDYLKDKSLQHPNDIFVPDHNARHVMFEVFLNLARQYSPGSHIDPSPIVLKYNTPFEHKSPDHSVLALSYATWTCPATCPEPQVCPHTGLDRNWDLMRLIQEETRDNTNQQPQTHTDVYAFECQQLLDEISYIPLTDVQTYAARLEASLINKGDRRVIIATSSHCHGILGQFTLGL
ncbi:MAG: hypothetical protein HQM16_00615 [Deltaproteobacteria bacterium]|nr:hypothetical protein [Deltaproteobacteria bacterium]